MTGIYRKEFRDLGLAVFCGRFLVTGSCAETEYTLVIVNRTDTVSEIALVVEKHTAATAPLPGGGKANRPISH